MKSMPLDYGSGGGPDKHKGKKQEVPPQQQQQQQQQSPSHAGQQAEPQRQEQQQQQQQRNLAEVEQESGYTQQQQQLSSTQQQQQQQRNLAEVEQEQGHPQQQQQQYQQQQRREHAEEAREQGHPQQQQQQQQPQQQMQAQEVAVQQLAQSVEAKAHLIQIARQIPAKESTVPGLSAAKLIRNKHMEYDRLCNRFRFLYYGTRLVAGLSAGMLPFVVNAHAGFATGLAIATLIAVIIDQVFDPRTKYALYSRATDLLMLSELKAQGQYEEYRERLETLNNVEAASLDHLKGMDEFLERLKRNGK